MLNFFKNSNNYSFKWKGLNKEKRLVQGEIIAVSMYEAKTRLRKQGIKVIKRISRKKSFSAVFRSKRIKAQHITLFARQLATLFSAGISLIPAFTAIYRSSTNINFKNLIALIKTDLESGSSLASALQKHPKYFNNLFVSLIDAGENSGSLELMLEKLAVHKERTEEIKSKIKRAMVYPIAILVVAIAITIGLLIFVVPQFEDLFRNFGGNLPFVTQMVINFSHAMQKFWWLILLFGFFSIVSFTKAKKKFPSFKERIDKLLLKVPLFGPLIKHGAISRFTRTLSITFAAGLPLVDALKSVAGVTDNTVITKAIMNACDDVSKGIELQQALKKTGIFPHMPIQMIAIGEKSGQLEKMLAKVAAFYEDQVNGTVDSLSSLLEPFTMVFLGFLVGTIVVAMYLPIFKLGTVI